ncbi:MULTISPECIES: GNAT family N-acetyltransferase [Streptomyces]|uniref:GNAT family N-acetyltransferase n=2 Tax=Streptomyces TaxID=1883 RepID=A0A3R7FH30_9ACTN|nr:MULTISPECIES: GNAT family N-acetyltransferase [Streptomyces]KNE78981.1 acetyltransferase [Streptomyces fradiae]OFA34039.1 GNAT family N-acetyltransferase [Streptomyces fradiae]PQM24135.1 GNAT family N-acetyltransferase [Streptomyces xinghaiensis]RKM97100.1 GNAT family N-acetyltransferase [Streptomyces xinghaiensis]RNC75507.1 GNAT family N-acetyltransferase [Streptomyces xinghaiensis]
MDFTTGGRLTVRITAADVGKRVSVRRWSEPGAPGGRFTDAVGVLTSWDGGVLCLTRRNGEIVRIPESALAAGKVVPAAPARRRGPAASAAELSRVAARAWPPAESEPLGGWTLRASGGFTRRANSVLPLGDPGLPADEALRRVVRWYAARGLPAYIQVTTGAGDTQEELAAALDARGWIREVSAEVRTAALAPVAEAGPAQGVPAAAGAGSAAPPVRLTRTPGPGWLRRYQRFAGDTPEVRRVLCGGPSVRFAAVPADKPADGAVDGEDPGGAPAAIGRCVVDGRWAGFSAVEVAPEQRRRGLASAVMAALAARALEEGASAAYLQVETDNGPARAFYDRLGFTVHHTYHHWRAPDDGGH